MVFSLKVLYQVCVCDVNNARRWWRGKEITISALVCVGILQTVTSSHMVVAGASRTGWGSPIQHRQCSKHSPIQHRLLGSKHSCHPKTAATAHVLRPDSGRLEKAIGQTTDTHYLTYNIQHSWVDSHRCKI